jgi:drug/metabolite transporter (DMT)-like permease
MTTPRQRRLAYLAWGAVCIIWGTTYFGIRVSLESMPPALMGGLRWTLAGTLLAAYVAARGGTFPPRSRWGSIVLLGFLLLVLGNGGVVVAQQWVPSGLAAVMVASSPFWMAGVEAALRNGERLTRNAVIGLVIGFSGIVVLVWPDLTTSGGDRLFVLGIVSLQIAALGWALGSAYSRRHGRTDDVLATTACQMLAGGLMMMAAGTVRGEWPDLFFTGRTLTALI